MQIGGMLVAQVQGSVRSRGEGRRRTTAAQWAEGGGGGGLQGARNCMLRGGGGEGTQWGEGGGCGGEGMAHGIGEPGDAP